MLLLFLIHRLLSRLLTANPLDKVVKTLQYSVENVEHNLERLRLFVHLHRANDLRRVLHNSKLSHLVQREQFFLLKNHLTHQIDCVSVQSAMLVLEREELREDMAKAKSIVRLWRCLRAAASTRIVNGQVWLEQDHGVVISDCT